MAKLYVRDLMTRDPFTLAPGAPLSELYDLMDAKHVRHIPIVDERSELQGLISHRDLMRSVVGGLNELPISNQRQALRQIKAGEIMQTGIETIDPNAEIRDAAQMMLENKFGCLPVVEGSKLVGILTEADFVLHILDQEI